MRFAQSGFAQFTASGAAPLLRAESGLALIAVGIFPVTGLWGGVLAVVAVGSLVAGVLDFCLLGSVFGGPFRDSEIRAVKATAR